MRHIKKLASIMLALAMVFTMAVGAFANSDVEAEVKTVEIVIDNALYGEEYNLYKIFDVTYDEEGRSYSYTLPKDSDFKDFFVGENAPGATYVSVDTNGTVSATTYLTEETAVEFANTLMAWVKERNTDADENNNVAPVATLDTPDPNKDDYVNTYVGSFGSHEMGYYIIDTTSATVFVLDTIIGGNKPEEDNKYHIERKSPTPVIDKQVQEDSTGNWGASNTADIGDTIHFKSLVKGIAKLNELRVQDTMTKGLTFKPETLKIEIYNEDVLVREVEATEYTLAYNTDEDTGITHITITFTKAFLEERKSADRLLITYDATLNSDAVVGGEGNPNTIWLEYGRNHGLKSTPSETITYTWPLGIEKFANSSSGRVPLAGAEFVIIKNLGSFSEPNYVVCTFDKDANGNYVYKSYVATGTDGEPLVTYNEESTEVGERVYTVNADALPEECKLISTDGGVQKSAVNINVLGLDAGQYIVRETKAPGGYNLKLLADLVVIREDGSKVNENRVELNNVQILNQVGSELPSTGGMGTTIFYVVGSILVVGAAVLMVTKRRMGKNI